MTNRSIFISLLQLVLVLVFNEIAILLNNFVLGNNEPNENYLIYDLFAFLKKDYFFKIYLFMPWGS